MLKAMKFDVVIVDICFNHCGVALAHALELPTIGFWPTIVSSTEMEWTTTFLPPSHIPFASTKFSNEMVFFERLQVCATWQ